MYAHSAILVMYRTSTKKYKKELLPSNNNNTKYAGITYHTLSREYKCRNTINHVITMCSTLLKSTLKYIQSVIAFFWLSLQIQVRAQLSHHECNNTFSTAIWNTKSKVLQHDSPPTVVRWNKFPHNWLKVLLSPANIMGIVQHFW